MLLQQMLSLVDVKETYGNLNIEIKGLSPDSRKISRGWLFVAIRGETLDGRDFIPDAVHKNAVAIVLDGDRSVAEFGLNEEEAAEIAIVYVPNARRTMAQLACAFYDFPAKKMKLVGVTGTKGKTTTTFMLKSALEKAGKKVGLIGSIGAFFGESKLAETDRTTPDSPELQRLLATMASKGAEYAIIEVSSQAMKMWRTEGCEFEASVFTNFSEDHISPKEHASMEEYFQCKCMLMDKSKQLILNQDDLEICRVREMFPEKTVHMYSLENLEADCYAPYEQIHLDSRGTEFELHSGDSIQKMFVSIPGVFSVYNALAAITAADSLGIPEECSRDALAQITVLGRSELVPNDRGISIMIDYAHTPSSLESILQTARQYITGKIICAWGVGGDRDKKKRPVMGEISGRLADYTVLMSDQVRTEDPLSILKDIEVGVKKTGKPYRIIVDRTEGIRYALSLAKPGDMVLIPGLGHDKYLERNGVKYPYDEREVIAGILAKQQV